MLDVENDTQGGPTLTLLNPPGGVCPALTGGCNSSFYDDRAYATLNGTVVNTPPPAVPVGNVLCGLLPPTVPNSDPVTGFDSTTTQRAFGAANGGNTNAPCTGNFGDAKGLDNWTYFPSNRIVAPLNIVAAAADIGVTKVVSNPTPAAATNVTFTITATNHGPNAATGVQFTDLLPTGLTFVSAVPSQGTYTAGTGIWAVGSLAVGASVTLQVVATVTGTSAVTNVVTRSASSPVDPNSANDVASVTVTGSSTPGLPADGVPPVAALWPALPASLFLFVGGLAIRRRRPHRSP
jgi:uncharacterized repeat protein (TIGR01451 family)